MKALILTNGYPDNHGSNSRMFIHVRNLYYQSQGLDFDVLNFATNKDYVIDGINVIAKKSYKKEKYNIAIVHSPNIRHHYVFLRKNERYFNSIIFFFHGFEIMKLNKDYPKEYSFNRKNCVLKFLQSEYDFIKLKLWRSYFEKLVFKSVFIFVSDFLFGKFKDNVGITTLPLNKYYIISNGVGNDFLEHSYRKGDSKRFDFITIRSNMDESTYCIDLVCEDAMLNPGKQFLIIGRGKFFKYNKVPPNVSLVLGNLSHKEIIDYLDQARCALMPTRWDTQGVMSCEMVTYGIPLITSDIPVCREVFDNCKNVRLIPNMPCRLDEYIESLEIKYDEVKVRKWDIENTSYRELCIIQELQNAE